MKKQLLLFFFILCSIKGYSQTYDALPTGSTPYGNQLYKTPDGLIIAGTVSAKFRVIGTKAYVDSLINLKQDILTYTDGVKKVGTTVSADNSVVRLNRPNAGSLEVSNNLSLGGDFNIGSAIYYPNPDHNTSPSSFLVRGISVLGGRVGYIGTDEMPFVQKSGDTMTGDLILANATPTNPLSAVPKSYVDSIVVRLLKLDSNSNDNSPAINAAILEAKGKSNKILLPSGKYKIKKQINLAGTNVAIQGNGSKSTFLDATGASLVNFPDTAIIHAKGGQSDLGWLSVARSKQDTIINLSTSVTLKRGDVLKLLDTAKFSFSKYRSYYTAGEFVTVKYDVTASSTVIIDGGLRGNYAIASNVMVSKMNFTQNNITGLSIIGLNTGNMNGITMHRVANTKIEDVTISNAAWAALYFAESYNSTAVRVRAKKYDFDGRVSGLNASYGIDISNSQKMIIDNCDAFGSRHAYTITNNTYTNESYTTSIPDRDVSIINSVGNSIEQYSFDTHGGCESIIMANNFMLAGVGVNGSKIKLQNNNIFNAVGSRAIFLNEANDLDMDISNNTINVTDKASLTGVLRWTVTSTDTTGTFKFKDNSINYSYLGANAANGIFYINYSGSVNHKGKFEFTNNTWNNLTPTKELNILIQGASGSANLGTVIISDRFNGVEARVQYLSNYYLKNSIFSQTYFASAFVNNVINTSITGNEFEGFSHSALTAPNERKSAFFINSATNVWVSNNRGYSSATNALYRYSVTSVTNLYEGSNSIIGATSNNYSSVTNRLAYDDRFINGLPNGQQITGGTGASENLALESTSNATKGKVITNSPLDVQFSSISMTGGADDSGVSTRTINTNKAYRQGSATYDNSGTDAIVFSTSQSSTNELNIAGGTGSMRARTATKVWAAANTTTTAGTEITRTTINGFDLRTGKIGVAGSFGSGGQSLRNNSANTGLEFYTPIATNTTTTSLSSATLTSTYPTTNIVVCPNITGGGLIYTKYASGWVQSAITITP